MVPPSGVNFAALWSRFQKTWVRRGVSADRKQSSRESSVTTRSRFTSTSRSIVWSACSKI